jgi:hypothetical protein
MEGVGEMLFREKVVFRLVLCGRESSMALVMEGAYGIEKGFYPTLRRLW